MKGKAFLDVARRLAHERTQADWRTAAGRAYCALLVEGKPLVEGGGFPTPPPERLHRFVRLCFDWTNQTDLQRVGLSLEKRGKWRKEADDAPERPGRFVSSAAAQVAVTEANDAVDLLDYIDADPGHRAAAIAAVRPPP